MLHYCGECWWCEFVISGKVWWIIFPLYFVTIIGGIWAWYQIIFEKKGK